MRSKHSFPIADRSRARNSIVGFKNAINLDDSKQDSTLPLAIAKNTLQINLRVDGKSSNRLLRFKI
ncbi:MAG: hypothetical protein JGK24_20050 [Microcoleus sp. PH2017_29_MFU_D_A]|uniref:hypothetical protein n=1 Tax=unclassified Microcoleus TaxID=2642155 RepID=UPI001E14B44C|nr:MULTISPECIES: hypothetical protein [unclassified Microcoleus]MCC3419130.1 hypothetical protein [Microcoleus sp. PH2017_07_MST_O_A]MCC3428557.1 hypothetical protein [Microcoleus sp. PH2017_04_SCI_O_A]MCC3445218.1 hypothetical protein [Microcoleus sp. PH2017_03_ELD_O_A]MCC3467352.1 hypothetical protein [Microcoleus sp. PH2017_06_SFM_O_A]MCC3507058.1 hypothetical protein [Microcoleus sp. PH2017_19_SFW_U_A]MCC3507870.1 hypothetical protein [Microcoleus sp. PH2017_17_BER_D_A]TAE05134.1 MAG: hy